MAFLFLNLPPEIRNQIFRHLLTHKTPILTYSSNNLGPPSPTLLYLCPDILLACRSIYEEGSSILYGENMFQAHPTFLTDSTFALDPCRPIGYPHLVAQIRRFHIRVRLDCDPYYKPEAVKKAFAGVDDLQVEVFRSSFGLCGYEALEGFAEVRGVRRPKVHGSVDQEFARWLEECMKSDCGMDPGPWEEH